MAPNARLTHEPHRTAPDATRDGARISTRPHRAVRPVAKAPIEDATCLAVRGALQLATAEGAAVRVGLRTSAQAFDVAQYVVGVPIEIERGLDGRERVRLRTGERDEQFVLLERVIRVLPAK